MNSFDLSKYIDIALRRKYWIIISFLVVVLAGLAFALNTPPVYEASTLILVQPQKVPEDYVRPIISTGIQERLRTITQQVTSRTNLEQIIQDYNLFTNKSEATLLTEQKVELIRKQININVVSDSGRRNEGNAFTISFKGRDPQKVMQITNALAGNFISENLKIRESQALGTSTFLNDELESISNSLAEKEEQLKEYRLKYMGSLPEQLNSNLSIIERLQVQLEQLSSNLRDAENRKLILQQQIAATDTTQRDLAIASESGSPPDDRLSELISRKRELALLESRYTENHPDIIRLKKIISKLEKEQAGLQLTDQGTQVEGTSELTQPIRADNVLISQLNQVNLEIKDSKQGISEVQSRINYYQNRIEETPKREQELLSLSRDYDNLKELYHSMLNRKLEADIAVSMEKKQKGEQFRVIDQAKVPNLPIKPDVKKIMLLALALGLGLGAGLAYAIEFLDTSYKIPEEAESELQLPILVSIPISYTEKELKYKRRFTFAAITSLFIVFILSAFGIVLASKGLDNTLDFLKKFTINM